MSWVEHAWIVLPDTRADPEAILGMRRAGKSYEEIAAALGETVGRVSWACVKAGLGGKVRAGGRPKPDLRGLAEIAAKYSVNDLATIYRTSNRFIIEELRRLGAKSRGNAGRVGVSKLAWMTPEQRADYDTLKRRGGYRAAEALAILQGQGA